MTASNHEAMNIKMVKFVPELASQYATYPMTRTRWLTTDELTPEGKPCFVKSNGIRELKVDYVFGRGRFGEGYCSLLTKTAYVILYARMTQETPGGLCCNCSKQARKEYDEFDDVRRIVYNRSMATIPNDTTAAHDAIDDARLTSQVFE
jgi:hypothetical protein